MNILKNTDQKVNWWGAWALAVGGMIGGGIYTLAGVILGFAGPFAWLSLLLGCLIALATVRSYTGLALESKQEGIPISYLLKKGHYRFASVLSWWLLLIYVLATAVYAYTFGHYIGRAFGASPSIISMSIFLILVVLIGVNLFGIQEPAGIQMIAVCIELLVLFWLASVGIFKWNLQNLASGVPRGTWSGIVSGTAATFIAFEGFEMLAYDLKELKQPRETMTKALPLSVIAVAFGYAIVTVGAASLVGARQLVEQKENALAVAGKTAAGSIGLIIVTFTACASAASAMNATLFSVSRLARTSAESHLLPSVCGWTNRRNCPHGAIIMIGFAAALLAITSSLEPLVQVASFAFLILFGLINFLAFLESQGRSWVSLGGLLAAVGSAIVVSNSLISSYPRALLVFIIAWMISVVADFIRTSQRRIRGEPAPEFDPEVQTKQAEIISDLKKDEPDSTPYRLKEGS